MALATRCPHCKTAFRVASDQLKLRAGLVRCGTCKEIFNGIENLLHPDEDIATANAGPAPAVPVVSVAVAPAESAELPPLPPDELPPPAPSASSSGYAANYAPVTLAPHWPATVAPAADDPRDATTDAGDGDEDGNSPGTDQEADADADADADVISEAPDDDKAVTDAVTGTDTRTHADTDTDAASDSASDIPADAEPAIAAAGTPDDLIPVPGLRRAAANNDDDETTLVAPDAVPQPKPRSKFRLKPAPAEPVATVPDDVPDFVARARQHNNMRRAVMPALVAGSVVLGAALIGQAIYASRTALAASFPALRPVLDEGCRMFGCSVGLPMQIESVSIESSDFQPVPGTPDRFLLTVLLRNRSATVQAWPTIELSLNDANDKAVGRRLIAPREYLAPGQTAVKGFSAGSEHAIRLYFDLARIKASGYRVYLFYP